MKCVIQLRTWRASIATLLLCAASCSSPSEDEFAKACGEQASGTACTWLGVPGEEGYNGNGLHRLATQVNQVQDMVFLPDGTAWFTDFQNFQVRKVLPDGSVESVVGWTDPVFPGDGPVDGIPAGGAPGAGWQLNHPTNLLLGDDGSVIIVAWHNHKLLSVDPTTNWVTVICGGGAGFKGDGELAQNTLFKQLQDAVRDDEGNLYIVDQQNQRVRRIGADGIMQTIAGTGTPGFSGDGGPAIDAELHWGFGSNPNPSGGIAYADNRLYIADSVNHRIRMMDLESGTIETIVGTGTPGFRGDGGAAIDAQINNPHDLEIGPDGDLYIADTDNGAVRALNLASGVVRTVVGTGELGLSEEEGLLATETQLRRPFGIAFDPVGNLYVMDSLNSRIVKVAK